VKEISDEEALKESLVHPEVFKIIYERYHDRIFRHIYKLTQNVEITKDLTEETFYEVIKYRETIIKSGVPFEKYIYRISTNEVYKYFNKEKKLRKFQGKLYAKEEIKGITDDKSEEIDNEKLREAIDNLPELKRICIIMYYFEDKNIEEIAVILNKGKSTVSRILNEARNDLREALWEKFKGKE
jgi:RNA polymerase sigma-70 factor (ECF subfamily)